MNTFGNIYRLTTFGESHGTAIGGIIDGCPAGIEADTAFIQSELNRRRPGQSALTTSRNEPDTVEFLSGLYEGRTTGTPIAFLVRNRDQHSKDYDAMRDLYRPSHADYTYQMKYGIRDPRGGGRSSARTTIAQCVGGAVAKLALQPEGITVRAYTSQVGRIRLDGTYRDYDLTLTETNAVRCPDARKAAEMEALIRRVKEQGDTVGGVITGVITGVPVGLGEPVFGKLHAALGAAMLGINAVKGVEIGDGFDVVAQRGSLHGDELTPQGFKSNHSGGILGGISTGQTITANFAIKPTSSIATPRQSIDIDGNAVEIATHGRHDPCVGLRAAPIAEAMLALVLMDHALRHRAQNADVRVNTPDIARIS